jgi:hypothetical protein
MSRKQMSDTELAARLDNIETTLKEIARAVRTTATPGEITPGSAAINMIARELANNPDQYSHKRRSYAGQN